MSGIQTFMSLMNDADNNVILTRMNEAPKELINEMRLTALRLSVLEAEMRDQEKHMLSYSGPFTNYLTTAWNCEPKWVTTATTSISNTNGLKKPDF